jgi:hypothetical protein
MAAPKRLVLFVEGEGDEKAIPVLVKHLLTEIQSWDCLYLDPYPFRVGMVADLFGRKENNWARFLGAVKKRPNLGGVLLLLDGDVSLAKGEEFCAARVGQDLSRRARKEGAGTLFSVASVFALQEFESWLIAGVESLAGKLLPPDNRPGVKEGVTVPEGNLEAAPRDAKKWLRQHMHSAYKQTIDQEPLTRLLVEDLGPLRSSGLRGFRRLKKALQELTNAIRSGTHIVTPEVSDS